MMERMATRSYSGVEGVEEVGEGVLDEGAEFEEVQVALAELVDGVRASAGGFEWEFVTFLLIFWHRCMKPSFYKVSQKGHLEMLGVVQELYQGSKVLSSIEGRTISYLTHSCTEPEKGAKATLERSCLVAQQLELKHISATRLVKSHTAMF